MDGDLIMELQSLPPTHQCPTCGMEVIPGSDFCENCGMDLQDLDLEPARPSSPLHASILYDRISKLEPPEPVTVTSNESIEAVVKKMNSRGHGAVCVVDSKGSLVGIFTERDAVKRVAAKEVNISTTPISEVMTRDPLAMQSHEKLGAILNKMSDAGFRHVPIMEGDRLVGITTVRGVLNYITEKGLS